MLKTGVLGAENFRNQNTALLPEAKNIFCLMSTIDFMPNGWIYKIASRLKSTCPVRKHQIDVLPLAGERGIFTQQVYRA